MSRLLKKICIFVLAFIIILSVAITINAEEEGIKVIINGKNMPGDDQLIIINGRTLVPLRAIFEALNVKILWEGSTKTVTALDGDTLISLQINNPVVKINGEDIVMGLQKVFQYTMIVMNLRE